MKDLGNIRYKEKKC